MSMGAMSQVKKTLVEELKYKGNQADFSNNLWIIELVERVEATDSDMTRLLSENNVPTTPQIRPSRVAHLSLSLSNHNHSH